MVIDAILAATDSLCSAAPAIGADTATACHSLCPLPPQSSTSSQSTSRSHESSVLAPPMFRIGPAGYRSSKVPLVAWPTPKPSTYSSFSVRSSHVEGSKPFGPVRLGRDGVPLLSGRAIASRISVKLRSSLLSYVHRWLRY